MRPVNALITELSTACLTPELGIVRALCMEAIHEIGVEVDGKGGCYQRLYHYQALMLTAQETLQSMVKLLKDIFNMKKNFIYF